jgi:putative transposase
VLVRKGFRYRIYPTHAQAARLGAWDDALRFLWNVAHEQRLMGLARVRDERRYPTAFDQINELTTLRAELPWLADVPRNVSAQLLVQLNSAWQRCFNHIARQPRWKYKGRDKIGLCEPHPKAWRLNGNKLHFPKLGVVRAVVHRPLEGKPKTCTIRRDGDQWFASIVCEVEMPTPVIRTTPIVALDRGVTNLVADSDGNIVASPRFYALTMKRLAHAQRSVSRRKRGSKNHTKAKLRVARLHRKCARQREHVVQNLSAAYAHSHGTVVVEKLQISNMVRANRGLARGILDAAWGRLVETLRYKLAWFGGSLIEVPAAYSSQTCFACGTVDATSRRGERFCCTGCGHVAHADVNAAQVLKGRANRSALMPVEGDLKLGAHRSRKRLRGSKHTSESSVLKRQG